MLHLNGYSQVFTFTCTLSSQVLEILGFSQLMNLLNSCFKAVGNLKQEICKHFILKNLPCQDFQTKFPFCTKNAFTSV